MQTRRERVRQAALDEIKSLSWDIINQGGVDDLTVNAVARKMGMTPPAFYRYFKNRDALIKTMVIDAYRSFGQALTAALDPEAGALDNLYRLFLAYREWAVSHPHMFALFAGRPVYGFENQDPDIMAEADRVHALFLDLYGRAWEQGEISGTSPELPEPYRAQLTAVRQGRHPDLPEAILDRALQAACLVHGMISMELSGRFNRVLTEPSDFYRHQIRGLLAGLTPPEENGGAS